MRIAVLSDTHDRLPANIPRRLAEADEIWHLGDVCAPSILTQITSVGPPVRVVRGNCDDCIAWPLVREFELEGSRIYLTHIPPGQPPPNVDLLLHGHTHVPRFERIDSALFLNPGCITRPNRGAPASWAWLGLNRDQQPTWELVTV